MKDPYVDDSHLDHWRSLWNPHPLRRAAAASIVLHAGVVLALFQVPEKPVSTPIAISYEVEFLAPLPPEPKEEPKVEPPPPKPPPPKKPEPKPKPEPAKVEKEKPKPKPPEKPKPKPPPPKPKKKPEPKEEPKPKPPPKPKPEAEPKPAQKTGVQMKQHLPPLLNSWGRLVQRKVEKYWIIPGGIRTTEDASEAIVSFWVDREGILIGRAEITQHAGDPALAESGLRAIYASEPLPPLPVEFKGDRQQVVYVFSMLK